MAEAILGLSAWHVITGGALIIETLRLVLFNVVPLVTSTGWDMTDDKTWGFCRHL